jgi:hypothetical protein
METIPYRNTKLHVLTIPKGTLLFRLVKNPEDDVRGIPTGTNDERCIVPNHNVYFHPNPFMGKLSLIVESKDVEEVKVYKTTRNLKVILLINPSKYSRSDRTKKRFFLKSCAKTPKGCLPRVQDHFNNCFSDSILEKHPEIVGHMSISYTDVKNLKWALAKRKTVRNKIGKYIHDAVDSRGITGPPEMILHPLSKRPSKPILVHPQDTLENNYTLIQTFSTQNWGPAYEFMKKHAVYNPDTYFFKYK